MDLGKRLPLFSRIVPKLDNCPAMWVKKNGKHGKEFKPSGIAVHPISGKIYVLASAGKKLLVLDENGNPKEQYNLNEDQFPQPEGICFTPNGDLIISSEGKNGQASISYFSFNDK